MNYHKFHYFNVDEELEVWLFFLNHACINNIVNTASSVKCFTLVLIVNKVDEELGVWLFIHIGFVSWPLFLCGLNINFAASIEHKYMIPIFCSLKTTFLCLAQENTSFNLFLSYIKCW